MISHCIRAQTKRFKMLGHFVRSTAILTGHYCRGISRYARPFGCIARKLATDQLLFCSLFCCYGLCNRLASAPDPFPALHLFSLFQRTLCNIERLGIRVHVHVVLGTRLCYCSHVIMVLQYCVGMMVVVCVHVAS